MSLELDPETLSEIANLPDDGLELDNNHVAGVLVRYDMACKLLPTLLVAEDVLSPSQGAIRMLVEKDIPVLLRTIAGLSQRRASSRAYRPIPL